MSPATHRRAAGFTLAAMAVVGVAGCATTTEPAAPAPASSSVVRSSTPGAIPPITGGPTGPAHGAPSAAAPAALPVRLQIPAIGVDSGLQHLGVNPDGTLQTPAQWQVAGWYAGGTRPGDIGPAVIAGHVDSVSGPAVFYRLPKLQAGTPVYVARADGTTVRFVVDHTAEYPKRQFPTAAVYGPSAVPTLRLVTCTGDFDYAERSYVDNLVVTAYASNA